LIRKRASARAGLIGNPSDGYHGKTYLSIAVLAPLDSGNADTIMPVGIAFELNQPGFPQNPGRAQPYNPATCADLSQDGSIQFVTSDTAGRVLVWNADGSTFLPGRTNGTFIQLPGGSTHSAVAVGDITGDNCLELVVAADNGRVYAYDRNANPVPGFPVTTGDRILASPVLCDLDRDTKKEVICASTDGKLHVWRGDGSNFPGFPIYLGSEFRAAVAITDTSTPQIAALGSDGRLFLINRDGGIVPGFPVLVGFGALYTHAAPVVGDLDHDGNREIVCVVSGGYDYRTVVVSLEGKTRYMSRAQIRNPFVGTPALADIDGDGFLEILLTARNSIYAFNHNGTLVSNYPAEQESLYETIEIGSFPDGDYLFFVTHDFRFTSSPVIAFDETGRLCIFVGSPKWGVLAIDAQTGRPLGSFPLSTVSSVSPTPLVCDADGDGQLELAVGSDDGVFHVWKLPGNAGAVPWGGFLRDPTHSGLYDMPLQEFGSSGPPIVDNFYIYPNPAEKFATVRFRLGKVSNASARIKILDVSGFPLLEIPAPACAQTENEQRFDSRLLPCGVHIARLEVRSDQGRAVRFYKLGVER
ncbi:MAG: hypothetical protein ABIK62_02070, partial [candidate division WOR-3 bacterium]